MRRYALGLLMSLGLGASAVEAQERVLRGVVRDDTGTPIPLATVEVVGTFLVATTGDDGRFALRVPSGAAALRVRRLGHAAVSIDVDPVRIARGEELVVRLDRRPATLRGLVVPGEGTVPFSQVLTRSTIRHAPPLGEPDVVRAVALLPGVSQPDDVLNTMHLAGAAADETLITLDGHPLYGGTHLQGIIGGFNMSAIDRAEVLAHHVPATSDTRLGGTLSLHTRERATRHDGEAIATLLATSVTVAESRLPAGGDLLVSLRRTYLDAMHDLIFGADEGIPAYADGLARAAFDVGGGFRVEGLGYLSSDWHDASALGDSDLARESLLGIRGVRQSARVRHELRLSQATTFARSAVRGGGTHEYRRDQRWTSASWVVGQRLSPRVALEYAASADHRSHRDRRDAAFAPSRATLSNTVLAGASAIEWRLTPEWELAAGARASSAGRGMHVAPRVALTRRISPTRRVELAYDRRFQYDLELDAGSPQSEYQRRLQVVALLDDPRRVDALAATFEWTPMLDRGRVVSLSGTVFGRLYEGRVDTLVRPEPFETFPRYDRQRARSVGIASGVTYSTPTGAVLHAAYTFAHSAQRFTEGWAPVAWDAPHTFAVLASYPLGRGWSFTTVAQVKSGRATTPIEGQVFVPFGEGAFRQFVRGDRNSARLPAFRRLDVAIRKRWTTGPLDLAFSIQAVNAAMSENWYDPRLEDYFVGDGPRRLTAGDDGKGLPLVPSLGLEIRW